MTRIITQNSYDSLKYLNESIKTFLEYFYDIFWTLYYLRNKMKLTAICHKYPKTCSQYFPTKWTSTKRSHS